MAHLILPSSCPSLCDLKAAQAPTSPSLSGWDVAGEEAAIAHDRQLRGVGVGSTCPVLDKILLSFLLSFPPASLSPPSIYNLANPWPIDSPSGTWQAASVEAGCFLTVAGLGEASAGQVGPLAQGTFDCLSRDPALLRAPPSRLCRGWEGGALSGNPATVQSCCSSHSRLLQPGQPGCLCVIHRVGVHAACF